MEQFFRTLPTVVYLNPKDQIQITKAELTADDFSLAVDLLNMSEHFVKQVTFAVKFKNDKEEYLFNETESFFTAVVELAAHSFYYVKPFSLDERFEHARAIDIRISDYYTDSGKHSYDVHTQSPFTLPVIPDEKLEKMTTILGPEIKTYGENLIQQWRCVCGAVVPREVVECPNCHRNKNFILNNLTEPLINAKLLNILQTNSEEPSLADSEEVKMHLTQTHLTKVAPTKEKLLSKRINDIPPIYETLFTKVLRGVGIGVGLLVFAIVVFIAFSFGKSALENHTIQTAHALIQKGEYEEALAKYEEVQKSDSTTNLSTEIELTQRLIHSNQMFQEGNRAILKDDFLGAVSAFKQVLLDDKLNYSKAEENIADLENSILDKAIDLSKKGNYKEAQELIKQYLAIVPESVNALRLQKSLSTNPATASVPQAEPEEYEAQQKAQQDRAKMAEKAKGLLYSYQKVVAEKGNLRSEPDVHSSILTVLPSNTDLYIKETKLEGSERIWCYVEAKNPDTGEISEGWISNKLMEK